MNRIIIQFYQTALHLAVQKNNIEIVKLLMEKKEIDVNITDYSEKKPIDYSENDKITELLTQ